MKNIVVVGCQFGDEGKGKIVDLLANNADMVVRFCGGNNAGHTVVAKGKTHKLHLIPSGILYKDVVCVLGNGVVLDPLHFLQELEKLEEQGINTDNLYISNRAHLILPSHVVRDKKSEERRKDKIGTTGKGIGPTYTDKVSRIGIRVGNLALSEDKLEELIIRNWNVVFNGNYQPAGATALAHDLKDLVWEKIKTKITDTSIMINSFIKDKRVLFEGSQGVLLDVDNGTYPYVTSSNPTAGGACTGSGIGPSKIDHVMGVIKAYTTRVGSGPFPTELFDEIGESLRTKGHEFGTTTGRPRRCGWLDLVALQHACRINGLDSIALTKLDILDGLDEIKICSHYELDGDICKTFPSTIEELNRVKPVYKVFSGWRNQTTDVINWQELPMEARDYITFISVALEIPIYIIGTGADRGSIIHGGDIWDL